MIQYNSINSFKEIHYNGHSIKSVYDYQANKVWPTIPSVYKWLATYNGGSVSYADCDGTSAITSNEITLGGLVDVQIGDCVTSIGESAFYNGGWSQESLTSVTIPNSVQTIGASAFTFCTGLTSVTIPDSVRTIGDFAFYVDWSARSLTLGSGVTSIGMDAFAGLSQITSLDIPDSVTSIGMGAFWSCVSLTSCTIGSGVTTIGDRAFYNFQNISGVTINATTPPTIGIGVFDGEDEEQHEIAYTYPIYVPCGSLAAYQTAWSAYASRLQCIPTPTFDGKWKATYNYVTGETVSSAECDSTSAISFNEIANNHLIAVEIGNCVTTIGNNALEYSRSLTKLIIGSNVTSIGNNAFNGCSGLTSVTIPNSVITIGNNAFKNCISLTSCTIGSGVTSLGSSAFQGCSGLTSVTIPNSVTSIDGSAFYGCSRVISCTIGSGVTSIGSSAFQGCSGLTSVTIPSVVTTIGDWAFLACRSLTAITCNAVTPPSLGSNVFVNTNNCPIYVPSESVSEYQSAWSSYASRIQTIT